MILVKDDRVGGLRDCGGGAEVAGQIGGYSSRVGFGAHPVLAA